MIRRAAALLSCCIAAVGLANDRPPNLVLIVADDLGYADVGFNGCEDIPTPHIDRIADEGARFGAGYVTAAVCAPSRAGFITGRHQDRFGCSINPTVDPSQLNGIPADERNIAELLAPAGYTSMAVGKWHLGTHPSEAPRVRGFDEFYGFLTGGHVYFPEQLDLNDLSEVRRKWGWYRTKLLHNGERVGTDQYLTDELSKRAAEFIEREAGRGPFFLYLAYNAPHTPLQALEQDLARFDHISDPDRRTYAAMVGAMDRGIGWVLDAIEQRGIDDDTLVVFLSDNGGASNNASRNDPLRGHKGSAFEGGLRVPFAMRWPRVIPEGLDYPHPVSSLDIAATFVAAAGDMAQAAVRETHPLDGVDLMPHLNDPGLPPPHAALFWRWHGRDSWAARDATGKLIVGRRGAQTYAIEQDVSESEDLDGTVQGEAIMNRIQALYRRWVEPMIAPIHQPLGSWRPGARDRND